MKKRVLQFIGSFHQGGSERQAIALTRMLKEDNTFDVRAATLNNEGILKPQVDALGLPETAEFPLSSFYNPNFLRQVWRCAKYLRKNEVHLVHTNDFYTNIFGMTAATVAGTPVKVASKRETGEMRSRVQELVEKIAFNRADAIVANSNAVRDHLISGGVSRNKIHVIYNGVDVASTNAGTITPWPFDIGPAADADSRFVTLVANLRHPVKNVPMLLRAAKRLRDIDENIHFIIAGEGAMRDELHGLAVRLGVARNVHFIGRCDDVPALLAASDACVLTSKAEGFSNSLVEYMAAGKPVVATNVGGAAEAIVDGESGLLVDSDDDSAMAGRLLELLNGNGRASAMGDAARKRAERFSRSSQLQKTVELYQSLLANA